MGLLIDQFCEAYEAIKKDAEYQPESIWHWVVIKTGPARAGVAVNSSIEQMRSRLERIVTETGIGEDVLIAGLIYSVDKYLEGQADPESHLKAHELKQEAEKGMAEKGFPQLFRDDKSSDERLSDLKRRRQLLDTWREQTAPILKSDNWKRWQETDTLRWLRQSR